MKVNVDAALCQGHARCQALAPKVFESEPLDGHAKVVVEVVPPDQEEAVRRAVRACPESAIVIIPDRGAHS